MAKRFTCKIDERDGHLVDVWYDNGKPIYSGSKVCDLLNELHEENEQLKSKNLILKGKLHQLQLKCGKQEEKLECLSEETIEQFKQDLKDGKFIEYTAR